MAEFHGIKAKSAIDAFSIAVANSLLKEMQAFLEDGVDIDGVASYSDSTALAHAAGQGLTRSVTFLLENKADIDKPGAFDLTPLMHACSAGKAKGSKIALQLISAGADVKYVRQADDMTALKFAVEECKPEVVQALIDHGAEIDGPADTDQTALMIAARANNVDSMVVLIENGADAELECKLPWAENRTAQGLAELEGCRRALKYLKSVSN